MPDQKKYTLCGGIFLVLLLQARKPRTAARKNAVGQKDGLNENELFEGLIRVAFPDFPTVIGRSFKTNTSDYKACKLSTNEYLQFKNNELTNKFDKLILNNYAEALKRMCHFSSTFIDESNMGNWLVRAILEVIHSDESITDELFYIGANGQPCDKKRLLAAEDIALQPFLLGVWHFIIKYRPDNTIGAETYNAWHERPTSTRARRKFISSVGKDFSRNIRIGFSTVTDDATSHAVSKKTKLPIADYSKYLHNAYTKYSKIKTLLYTDSPQEFYKFYVCNDISQKFTINRTPYRIKTIKNATSEVLKECSNFVLISGTGGLGKSMMMRHLLLDAINRYSNSGQIPIFIPLKDYDTNYSSLFDYVHDKFRILAGSTDTSDFNELLSKGSCLLLFDGLDEIKSDCRKKFEQALDSFADKYSSNMFIISSRPTGALISLHRFTVLDLCPFTKEQAVKLIEKLDFRTDEPSIKEKFKHELETTLFVTHREFTQNPLLLTIMLMTYEQFAEIPSKMHIFYHEAYLALSQKHDASKGAFKRVLKTGLTSDQFANYFAEFCARSYKDEKFEFTDILFDKYFNELHELDRSPITVSSSDFRDDLTENMCLMFYESSKYHFTHRSFQEYFCALYFSRQKDKTLKHIGDFFENKRIRGTDKTFNMLYDMIPDKIDEYILEPFLKDFLNECDQNNGYWTFLEIMYPSLFFETGETNRYMLNTPQSFLYDFIISKENIHEEPNLGVLELDEDFLTTEWVYLDEDYLRMNGNADGLIERDEIPSDYKEYFESPDAVGWSYDVDIDTLLNNPDFYGSLIETIEAADFPLMKEYENVKKYYQKLLDNHKVTGDDLFDLF